MILTPAQIHSIMHEKARELRFSFAGETFPEEGEGETCPVRSKQGRPPACWILIVASSIDDEREEYVYEFRRVAAPDTPRLLAPTGCAGDGLGYTSNPHLAMRDEPEAVDEWTQVRFANAAEGRDKVASIARTRADKRLRELLSVEERMVRAQRAARMNNVNIQSESYLVRRKLKEKRPETAVLHTLSALESRAYRDVA